VSHLLLRSVRRLWQYRRRATAVALLAALVVSSAGIAVPLPSKRQTTEPYPCENCSCGCANAEMCWRNCCCYSNEQKIVWARKHGVTPPAFVLAAVKKPACCQRKVASCCSSERSCCEKSAAETKLALTQQNTRETGKRRSASIVLLQALRCQGLSVSWTLLPPTVLPPTPQIDVAPDGLTECLPVVERSYSGQRPPPDLPPPKYAI